MHHRDPLPGMGPIGSRGAPLYENQEDLAKSLVHRQALYAPPFQRQDGVYAAGVRPHALQQHPLQHQDHRNQGPQHLTFDQMPSPPHPEMRRAMAPVKPPRHDLFLQQEANELNDLHDANDDSSSTSSESFRSFHELPYRASTHQVYSMMDWRLRRQSKRLRKKLRGMRQEMRALYQAIHQQLVSFKGDRPFMSHPSTPTSSSKHQGSTALWCMVVGLSVGFVFLLILLILCWTRLPSVPHSHGTRGSPPT